MRCCYLGMDDLTGYVSDADLSVPAMEAAGWRIERQSWRATNVDWSRYDMVYICTPWDYHKNPDEFLQSLECISAAGPMVLNPVDIVRWNVNKTYMRELADKGIAIVPSLWFDELDEASLKAAFTELNSAKLVIKPVVGASALDTFVLSAPMDEETFSMLSAAYVDRPFFVQPFVESVQTVGEYSLFFFDGDYSHTILKVPASGDFRTQEEHGSDIRALLPIDGLLPAARKVLDVMPGRLAYARVDFVLNDDGQPLLMELELIEPSLYFRTDPESPERFARAITDYYDREA